MEPLNVHRVSEPSGVFRVRGPAPWRVPRLISMIWTRGSGLFEFFYSYHYKTSTGYRFNPLSDHSDRPDVFADLISGGVARLMLKRLSSIVGMRSVGLSAAVGMKCFSCISYATAK